MSAFGVVFAQDSISTAKIEFNTDSGSVRVFSCPPDTTTFQNNGDAGVSFGASLADVMTYGLFRKKHKKKPVILQPPLGQATSFSLQSDISKGYAYGTVTQRCGIRFDLTPQEGKEYRAIFTPGPGAGQCSVKLEQRDLAHDDWLGIDLQPSDDRCK